MQEANIRCLAIGFESVIDEELRAMRKGLKSSQMLEMVKAYRERGFLIHGMFIFGYPMRDNLEFHMEAKERAAHFKNFIRKAKLDTVQVLLPVPLPGTTMRLPA